MIKDLLLPILAVASLLTLFGTVVCGIKSVDYKIVISPTDLSAYDIEIHVPDAKGTVRLAMAAHPEYDDRYFRYVENFSAESGGRKLAVTKPEEAVWQIDGARDGLIVRYRVNPAPEER